MIYGLVLVLHVLVALFLIGVILLQGGRGGLGEALGGAAAQSLFGGGANTVMTKLTAVVAGLFMATCVSLAILSSRQGQSVIDRLPASASDLPLPFPTPGAAPTTQQGPAAPITPGRAPSEAPAMNPAPAAPSAPEASATAPAATPTQ